MVFTNFLDLEILFTCLVIDISIEATCDGAVRERTVFEADDDEVLRRDSCHICRIDRSTLDYDSAQLYNSS